MFKSVKTGKIYVNLSSYDYDQRNEHGQDFSISLPLTEEQKKQKESGVQVKRIFVGNGRIWEENLQHLSDEEIDNLQF